MATLEEMATAGAEKLRAKAANMAANYDAAKARMIDSYNATPFGPTKKANYRRGVENATYRTPDVDKWRRNWTAAMSE